MTTIESYADSRGRKREQAEEKRNGAVGIVGAFAAFVAVAFLWIALFFGVVQPWLDGSAL